MTGASTALRPHRRLAAALIVAVVGAGVMQVAVAAPKAPPSGVKNYTAAFDPASAVQGGTATLVLANCGSCGSARVSNTSFGSAQITDADGVFDLAGASPGLGWTPSTTTGTNVLTITV